MSYYLVKAKPKKSKLKELSKKVENEEFKSLEPFGRAITKSLKKARFDPEKEVAVWEEEDYCSPPLKQEKEAVLNKYFKNIKVEKVEKGEGWKRIEELPSLWNTNPKQIQE